jgi:hypothetical protein
MINTSKRKYITVKFINFYMIAFVILSTNLSFAGSQTFRGTAKYTVPINNGSYEGQFSALEQLGVERAAEVDAINLCAQSGAENCIILNATAIHRCNFYDSWRVSGCEATATARGTL